MVGLDSPHPAGMVSFQYSLCRVVLMVLLVVRNPLTARGFQYSLCRVVLMVMCQGRTTVDAPTFSTRSVESF